MQLLPPPARGQKAECARCLKVLAGAATGRIGAPLALSVAALLLLVPATIAPLLLVTTHGADREAWLPSTAAAMWNDGFASLGVLIGVFAIALPYAFLGLLIWVLGNLHWQTGWQVGTAFRWAKHLRPWVMIEVFLVGSFVSYSRIKAVSNVTVEVGGWALVAAGIMVLIALIQLDERTVWETLRPQRRDPMRAPRRDETVACIICDLIVDIGNDGKPCPRCGATLHVRKPASIQRTVAYVVAGYLLYIPANTLPVLTTVQFGRQEHNTILSGVIELVHNDLVPLAVIVFMASIVLPLVKLFGLTWMLLATRLKSSRFLVSRTQLYRTIDTIGRWSNIDIFSVAMLVAVLQFGALTAVHSGPGLVAFAAVVIITMLATAVFDSRLMWDAVAGTVTERE
ncbi:MAG: paraquat-inducible protein A [Proteobacteria bacterium]|nr:paraquat-inducible protein A [Pseudomonadota bacterium]